MNGPSEDVLNLLNYAQYGPQELVYTIEDMGRWMHSRAYYDIVAYINNTSLAIQGQRSSGDYTVSPQVRRLCNMLTSLERLMQLYPPIQIERLMTAETTETATTTSQMSGKTITTVASWKGSLRSKTKRQPPTKSRCTPLGNQAYRSWSVQMHQHIFFLLERAVAPKCKYVNELGHYLSLSFGHSTHITYGPDNELMFLFFLCGLFKAEILLTEDTVAAALLLFERYMRLVRRLIVTYGMSPTREYGQWFVDDFYVLPYLWGSAQLSLAAPFKPYASDLSGNVELYRHDYMLSKNLYFLKKKHPDTIQLSDYAYQLWCVLSLPHWPAIYTNILRIYLRHVLGDFKTVQHAVFCELMSFEQLPHSQLLRRVHLGKWQPDASPSLDESGVYLVQEQQSQHQQEEVEDEDAEQRQDEQQQQQQLEKKKKQMEQKKRKTISILDICLPRYSRYQGPPVDAVIKKPELYLNYRTLHRFGDNQRMWELRPRLLRLPRSLGTTMSSKAAEIIFPLPNPASTSTVESDSQECKLEFEPEIDFLLQKDSLISSIFGA